MTILTDAQLAELEQAIAAMPPGPYIPSGRAPNYFGFHFRFKGGFHQVGQGDMLPSLVRFFLLASTNVPALVREVRQLRTDNERLRQQAAVANGKLSAVLRSQKKEENK